MQRYFTSFSMTIPKIMAVESIRQRNAQRDAFVKLLKHGYRFVLKGSTHSTYITDEAVFGQIVPGMQDPLATINGARAVTVIDAYVAAFFDMYLKQDDTTLLNGDSSQYPDVEMRVVAPCSGRP